MIASCRSARLAERSSALRCSPFRLLEANDLLGLVLGRADVLEHSAFCVTLVCRNFRDQVFERYPLLPGRPRLTTQAHSVGLSVSRLVWARGLVESPRWLARWDAKTCEVLASVGSKAGLGWAREGGCAWDSGVCVVAAARGGHLDVLEWLDGQGVPYVSYGTVAIKFWPI